MIDIPMQGTALERTIYACCDILKILENSVPSEKSVEAKLQSFIDRKLSKQFSMLYMFLGISKYPRIAAPPSTS